MSVASYPPTNVWSACTKLQPTSFTLWPCQGDTVKKGRPQIGQVNLKDTKKKNTLLGPYIKEKYIFQLESQCISWQK